jgi:NAD(P)H dehydrogenase (quinone)
VTPPPGSGGNASAPGRLGVTGSTGRLGGRVAAGLAAAGVAQTLLVRDPSRAPRLDGAQVRRAAYGPGASDALAGIDTLFMVSGAEAVDRVDQHRGFLDAAVAAGVRHVVYTSFFGAAPDCTFTLGRDHWATEQHLRASGMSWTFLRDNLYLDFLPRMVGDDDVIRGPAGDGRVSAVATDDVAAVAEVVLRDPGAHTGQVYSLTGPEAHSMEEVARTLRDITGRPVRFHDETLDEARASRAAYGAPVWMVEAWVSTYTAIAAGEVAAVTDDVPRLTGRPATCLRQLLTAS